MNVNTYLCHLHVSLLWKLRLQQVRVCAHGCHLEVKLQPGDGCFRTKAPLQCLREMGQVELGKYHSYFIDQIKNNESKTVDILIIVLPSK